MAMTLGEKVYKLRRARGLTLERLAELSDSSKSYIWELENKNPPRPSAEKISKIAAQLGVTMDYLIDVHQEISEDDATDEMFFRMYRQMDPEVKSKIRKIIDLWKDE
jgi:transcriptional regulator with XRE-family HTH domain